MTTPYSAATPSLRAGKAFDAGDFATALELATPLAEAGDPRANFIVGRIHSLGHGVPEDAEKAASHYRRAAEAGFPQAQHALATLLAQGRGVQQDFAEAMRWYRAAAEGNVTDAFFKVGLMYAEGEGVAVDHAEALRWWERAAERDHAGAMLSIGEAHRFGHGCELDLARAADWYLRSWRFGEGDVSRHSAGVLIHLEPHLERLADAGDVLAQHALGVVMLFGHKQPDRAVERLDQAATQGHAAAQRLLGWMYLVGNGVAKDERRAVELLTPAAEAGDKEAQFNLAFCYAEGLGGLARDVDLAIRWYRRAADQGVAGANLSLARLLAARNRDRRDANEAVQRLLRAARDAPEDTEFEIAAPNGEWSYWLSKRGAVSALRGITLDELEGLPDDD